MARPKLELNLTPRQRLAVKIAGYALLAIVTFLVTLHLVFPYERLKGKAIEVLSAKYDVSIASVGRGLLPGQVVFEKIVLRSRPTRPDEKATEITIDRLEVDIGLDFNIIGALRRKVALDFEAELGAGELEGELDLSKSMVEVRVATSSLPLETVPGLATAIGLPMTGGLDADVEIRLPGGKWKNAEGRVALDCDDCTIGDGVSKLTLSPPRSRRRRTSGWGADARSITVPRLSLGDAAAQIDISKGVGKIVNFAANSNDGWLKITGTIEFQDPFTNTLLPGCMQFKLSDELKKREPNFGNIEYGISEKLRQEDGSYSIPTAGKLTALKWDPRRKCGGGSAEEDEDEPGGPPTLSGRPTLTPELPAPGVAPIDPSSVPGVSGDASAAGATEEPPIPPPGGAGPELAPATPDDAGAAAPEAGESMAEPPRVDRELDGEGEEADPRDRDGDRDPEDRDGRGVEETGEDVDPSGDVD